MSSTSGASDLELPLAFRIGVTGHRTMNPATREQVRSAVRSCLGTIEGRIGERGRDPRVKSVVGPVVKSSPLRIVSPLAEGADRLVAEEGLRLGAELDVPLPLAQAEYEKDFPATVDAFRSLLEKGIVFTLDGIGESEAARVESYRAVGRFVVRNCDLLIAIWDGAAEHGVGGTAEIVRFAIDSGVPVWWIHELGAQDPKLLSRAADLHSRQDTQTGAAAISELCGLIDQAVAPPMAPPAEFEGLLGWFAPKSEGLEASPLEDFLNEKPLPKLALWRTYSIFMSLISPRRARHAESSPPPDSKLEMHWQKIYDAADRLSNDYGDRYRSSYVLIALLAVAALVLEALVGEGPLALDVLAIVLEIASLAGIALLVLGNQRYRWHERWISYRLLAELCRKQYILCSIGRALSGTDVLRLTFDSVDPQLAPREGWIAWYFMAALRAAEFPRGDMEAAKRRALASGRALLDEQITYHEGRFSGAGAAGRRIGSLSELFFALTLVLAFVKLIGLLAGADLVLQLGGLFGALLSAGAGACVGIRAYAEFSMLSQQSAYMLRVLKTAAANLDAAALTIDRPLSSGQLSRTLYAMTSSMMQDITGWAHLFRIKTIETG